MEERKNNCVIGFWLLFNNTNEIKGEDKSTIDYALYELAKPNREYFDAIREGANKLLSTGTNVYILIENIVDEWIFNVLRYKLMEYKVTYTKLINTKEGLNESNSLQMVINTNTGMLEFVSLKNE